MGPQALHGEQILTLWLAGGSWVQPPPSRTHYQSAVKFTPVTFPEVTVVDLLPGRNMTPDLLGVTVYEPAVTPVKV